MGMAASQARFLGLTARKTNTEYEGQQINQQRTALSNESASYYSRLTNLSVPTPPSTQDYSKITYTFTNGSETNTINQMIATRTTTGKTGYYLVNYTQKTNVDSVVSNGTVIVNHVVNEPDNQPYYIGNTKLRLLASSANMTDEQMNAMAKDDPYLSTLEKNQLADTLQIEAQYYSMLQEKYYDTNKKWFVRYQKDSSTQGYVPVFYSYTQVTEADYSKESATSISAIKSYVYGQTEEALEIRNAKARAEQDTSGRYITLTILQTDSNGNIVKDENGNEVGTTYQLTSTNSTDDNAYNDAMNQYSYDKSKYDKEIQDINAKIEIIQAQDKNLELKLKQLDTERNAIDIEMDAVKKVISKNVDNSFKTFNA